MVTDLALSWALAARGKTARAARRLLGRFGTPEEALAAGRAALLAVAQEEAPAVEPLLAPLPAAGLAAQRRRMDASAARLVLLGDAEYPPLLRETPDPPVALFVRGAGLPAGPFVAVVGARRASRAGLEAARLLAAGLARAGVTVVSGFARGIDAAAHRAALDEGEPTLAVLGCGVDVCYPPEQTRLLGELLERGAALSEFPMGTGPLAQNFPVRNRVIAGMVPLVLVVEAAEKSGSLITARLAADYGRDVAAVPGPIVFPGAAGTNSLLKDGAILVRNVEDLLVELAGLDPLRAAAAAAPSDRRAAGGRGSSPGDASRLDPDARLLLAALDADDPLDADALALSSGLSPSRLSAALVALELEGLAQALPGALFVRRRDKT